MPTDEVMRRYYAELLRLVEGSDLFQVLAHLDFPRRMWPRTAPPYDERDFEPEIRAVLRALAASDRVLEVNTKSPLASAELLGWWRDSGGTALRSGATRTSTGGSATGSRSRSTWPGRRASGPGATGSTSGGDKPAAARTPERR